MNSLFNTFQFENSNGNNMIFEQKRKQLALQQPDSLFSMALYDFDSMAQPDLRSSSSAAPPHAHVFHPVDEYKDLSLKEILTLSDDFLFDEDDIQGQQYQHQPNAPSMYPPTNNHEYMMAHFQHMEIPEPTPLPEPTPMITLSCKTSSDDGSSEMKRKREVSESCSDEFEYDENGKRFRPYQAGQWCEKFEELLQYKQRFGSCLVPHTFKENLPLARWVKRQRYQYKLMQEGKPSTMTEERVKALEDIGFVWDSQGAAWGERLGELNEFLKIFLHCNVPSNYAENPQLATWVKCQRRQYKLYQEGKPSNMTPFRIQELERLGFEWELRAYKRCKSDEISLC